MNIAYYFVLLLPPKSAFRIQLAHFPTAKREYSLPAKSRKGNIVTEYSLTFLIIICYLPFKRLFAGNSSREYEGEYE